MLILICLPFTNVLAASKLNLYYYGTKENVTYTGQQVKYYYNGAAINMKNTPGLVINGTSLASVSDVFVNSSIKMKSTYNSSKGILTLTQNGTTLVLTANSKTATLNGKKVTLSIAPMNVKYKDQNITKLLVPARFVAESFGYTYFWDSAKSTAFITPPLTLNYNGKDAIYTGTKGTVTVDGSNISMPDMPSIIINNTAMLRAWKVFGTGQIGAKYKYDSATGTVTLTKDKKVVTLTLGSKVADVNGESKTMDTAPVVVTNLNNNTEYVMVPGSFVASYLGYDYRWNASAKTSEITTKSEVIIPDTKPVPDSTTVNLGLSQNYVDPYTSLSSLSNATEISQDTGITAYISNITKELVNTTDREVYAITANQPFSKTTATLNNQVLNVHINNAAVNSTSYTLGGTYAGDISASNTYLDNVSTTDINIPLLKSNTNYALSLSSDGYTLYVTLYTNYINSITAGTLNGNDFIEFKGLKDLSVNLSESGNSITLEFLNTINGVGDTQTATGLKSFLSLATATTGTNSAIFVLEKASDAAYSVTQEGSIYRITFTQTKVVQPSDYSIKFAIPSDVFYSDITTEDRYYENKILFKIPGDQTAFYNVNPITYSNPVIKSVSLKYANGFTYITIATTKLQGFKYSDLNSSVGVILGNPRDIYKNIVVLDAGHGGTDPGAVRSLNGKTIYEKDLNYKIMYTLTQKYFNDPNSEVKAYYSRYDETKVNLYDRAAFATKVGADVFVSLHMNANNNTSPNGTEIYYYEKNTSKTTSGLTSKSLATYFLNSLPGAIGTNKRYISSQNYVVIRETKVPAILVELGFMSNEADLKKLTNSSFQEKTAKAMYDTLCSLFRAYPTGR
jgi:N-acetylmuramoyl-L-alanine amidase